MSLTSRHFGRWFFFFPFGGIGNHSLEDNPSSSEVSQDVHPTDANKNKCWSWHLRGKRDQLEFTSMKALVRLHWFFFSSVVKAPTLKKLIEFHRSSKVVGKGVGNFWKNRVQVVSSAGKPWHVLRRPPLRKLSWSWVCCTTISSRTLWVVVVWSVAMEKKPRSAK